MCGIAGEVNFKQPVVIEAVRNMAGAERHRGPDHEAMWTSDDRTCSFAHARLSIIDLSSSAHQPMMDPETKNVIIYNGEIYNFKGLREKCRQAGYPFQSESDTEVILALYRQYGKDCVHYLRGMFAFTIWDASKRELFLARDRMGEKPLYYATGPNFIVWASELQAILQHPLVGKEVNREALALYLELQYIPAPFTIYKNVQVLMPATRATFSEGGLKTKRYWELDYRKKVNLREWEVLEELEYQLKDAVRSRLIADVPLGATLSGGVDSSLVVALMAKEMNESVKTFTVSHENEEDDESCYAKEVAEQYATEHHVLKVKPNIQELLPKMAHHYGQPFGDKGAVPAFLVSQFAKEKVSVALNGDGGDELMGGYPRYQIPMLQKVFAFFRRRNARSYDGLSFLKTLPAEESSYDKIRRRYFFKYCHPELQSLGPPGDIYWVAELRRFLFEGTDQVSRWQGEWLRRAKGLADNPVDQMLWLDQHLYLSGDGLIKTDVASMHCSLEARTPLVDHQLLEFCATIPSSFKNKKGIPKYLLKKIAEKYLPESLIYRKKKGFRIPIEAWLKGPLASYVQEIILDPNLMEPFNRTLVQKIWQEFLEGHVGHAYRIWLLFIYGIWREEVFLKKTNMLIYTNTKSTL